MRKQYETLRLVLGDQLNLQHSWFEEDRETVCYAIFEMRQETDYAYHHIQKVVGFFAAMRAFAKALESKGHHVIYRKLDDPDNAQTLDGNLNKIIADYSIQRFEYLLPDEYRLDLQLEQFCAQLAIPYQAFDTDHFMGTRMELADFFKGQSHFLMEDYYRHMRRKYHVLMDEEKPLTGKWNYDAENRKKVPAAHVPVAPLLFEQDVSEIYNMVQKAGIKTVGKINPRKFIWPINREESLRLIHFFLEECLPFFGKFQDAMVPRKWSLYHSRLAFSLNTKMIGPLEVVYSAEQYWKENQDKISIAQVEGFIRQVIGWREYMRGIYWAKMPEFAALNFFNHRNKLPSWFWTGKTKMHCLKDAIGQTLEHAYAHHIQRLMVIGNFALLAGIDPDEVDMWYLGVYIDAIEWVQITNTRGMSQFADGGIVGTKPYVASSNYIDKMSHHCATCYYDKKRKTGKRACPFNSLHWNFYASHRKLIGHNYRLRTMYKLWDKRSRRDQASILKHAKGLLEKLDSL